MDRPIIPIDGMVRIAIDDYLSKAQHMIGNIKSDLPYVDHSIEAQMDNGSKFAPWYDDILGTIINASTMLERAKYLLIDYYHSDRH